MFDNNFLLQNETAKELYKTIKNLPIIDYHNHLNPQEIYENRHFTNIADMWLKDDHYKWRLMRFSGVDEDNITNFKDKYKAFLSYAETIEKAYLNPLYFWSHMELKEFFEIDKLLSKETAKEIYDEANDYLRLHPKGPKELLTELKVETLCTTDDLNSDLKYHQLLEEDKTFKVNVLPTFRPDNLFTFDELLFEKTIIKLENIMEFKINSLALLEKALNQRLNYFDKHRCQLADHGISLFKYQHTTFMEANAIYQKRYSNQKLSLLEIERLNSYLLSFFLNEYSLRNWTVQYHLGASRDNNTVGLINSGKDSGYDSINTHQFIDDFNAFLNDNNEKCTLPRIIIYPLNSALYEATAAMCANFSKGLIGKIQLGAAWWFLDNKRGIERQLSVFAEFLNLNYFIGMVTDSRSFLSFVRHDYFRRILANFIGKKVEEGLIPYEIEKLNDLVKNIAYQNSKNFLDF